MGFPFRKKDEGAPTQYVQCGIAPGKSRKCRDVLCLVLFLVFWVGMLVVAMVGLKNGNPNKLVYATDYTGKTCGEGTHEDSKYIHFPRLAEDLLEATQYGLDPLSIQFFGICVPSCPTVGETVCKYNSTAEEDCWNVYIDTEPLFYRCLPLHTKNETVGESRCIDPPTADPDCTAEKANDGECSEVCLVREVQVITWKQEDAQPNPMMDQMQMGFQTLSRWLGDVEKCTHLLLVAGVQYPVLLGVLFLILMQYFAGCMIWFTCIFAILSMVVLSVLTSAKAGIINQEAILASLSANITIPDEFETAEGSEKLYFTVAAYVAIACTLVLTLLVLFMKQRIWIAVGIVREASKAIRAMPLLLLWPVIPTVFSLVLLVYWIYIAAYIASSDELTAEDFSQVAGDIVSSNQTNITGLPSGTLNEMMLAYHLFGLLWTNQVIQAISMCTIAGAISSYYWTRPISNGRRPLGRFPILKAFARSIRYHIGSLIFGALVIAVVQFARCCLEYVDRNTRQLQDKNVVVRVAMKAVKCCLWCFEKLLKFLSKNAYIIIAMKGRSFCGAARDAFFLILANVARIATVNVVSMFLMLLAKITITASTGAIVFYVLDSSPEYQAGGANEVSNPMLVVTVAVCLAFYLSSVFLDVFEMGIDTILLCFCEDSKVNKGGQVFMSPELAKYIGEQCPKDDPAGKEAVPKNKVVALKSTDQDI